IPEGFNKTFAELTAEEKNQISHRALALKRLSDFLEKINH
ncbi:MAG TPA: non-canonical purine NTP pyrophosphatase, partial [Paludibacteraceae bacterium]|nr:non-canonical purine NTP pyrophosphatase [Paludibacteraceae bacterium]